MKTIYLDNNATTRVAPEVMEALVPYLGEYYGNPSSMHSFGGQVSRKLREAREQVAALLGAESDEIIFTSCGTESDSTAVLSALNVNPGKRHIVTSRVEHPAIKALCERLGKEGYYVTEVPVDSEGNLDMDEYRKSLTPDTALVSLMWANNETGVIFPVEEAAATARERGNSLSYRCGADSGKDPGQHEGECHRHALPLRAQASRTQRYRGSLRAQGNALFPFPHRGPPGKRQAGRDREHPEHHRAGKGIRARRPKLETENTPCAAPSRQA